MKEEIIESIEKIEKISNELLQTKEEVKDEDLPKCEYKGLTKEKIEELLLRYKEIEGE